MKSILKNLTLALILFSFTLGGCQDATLKEIDQSACTSCPPEEPPPPGRDD